VALLGLLHLLARSDGWTLCVGHVDHGLRDESASEAEAVRSLAHDLGVPCEVRRLTLEPGPGLPDRARKARHQALREMARHVGTTVLALGHTATDQAETVLLHLCRGAGLDGLSAMPRAQPGVGSEPAVVRPLLDLTRAEVRELAQRLELPFVDDPTNDEPAHPRVVIRSEILPRLEALRSGAVEAIAAAADRLREADEALDAWAARELAQRRIEDPRGSAARAVGMSGLPRAVRTRMIRAIALQGGVQPDAIGRRLIDQVDRALHEGGDRGAGPARSWDLAPGRRLWLADGHLRLEVDPRGSSPPGSV
jgi:tRNA(Ile)-lysidine synthase